MLALLLVCMAPFDDGSFYKIEAKINEGHVQSPLLFSYETTDGLDLKAKLKVSSESFLEEKSLQVSGSNGNMSIKAGADYWAEDRNYQGALEVNFAFEGTPPVEAVMECKLGSGAP